MYVKLRQLVERGVLADVYAAEQAHAIFMEFGNQADRLNSTKGAYKKFFWWSYWQAQNATVLALARVFDRPSKKHNTRCFLGLVEYLESNSSSLPEIHNRDQLFEAMRHAGMKHSNVDLLGQEDDEEITRTIVEFFRLCIENSETQDSLDKAKSLRNKRLAHNEEATPIKSPTWDEVLKLLDLAKSLVSIVGWAYLSTAYLINGEFILSSDARAASLSLRRVIEDVA